MISIIIPTYNSAARLRLLLKSIYNGSNSTEDFETIVVDDCSADETLAVVKEFPLVKLLKLDIQSGPAFARNFGARKAKGNILFFTDADTVLFPDTLANTKRVLSNNPGIKCFLGNYDKVPANSGFMPRYKALLEYSEEIRLIKNDNFEYTSFAPRPGIVYKDVFFEIGGFNTGYKGADIEDMEFGYRVSKKYIIKFSPEIKIKHNYPDTLIKEIKPFARRCFLYARLLIYRKKVDKAGEASVVNIFADLAGFGSFIILISYFIPYHFAISFVLFSLFVLFLNNFCWVVIKEENLLFLVKSVLVRYLHTVVMGFSVVISLLTLPFSKRKNQN